MSNETIKPATLDELRDAIVGNECVLPIGHSTKPALVSSAGVTRVSLGALQGITQYDPSEFTLTALAGTTMSNLVEALAERCQYLPFDPMLVDAGATLGGTIASGLAGPGRFRFGGVRDFVLGVEFESGDGMTIRAGGKVVKNAAGFDIPKLLVGSLGRLGAITSVTMKVFPRPAATQTLVVDCESHLQALRRIAAAARSRWELDAIDYAPAEQQLWLRLAGPAQSNTEIAGDIRSSWGDDVDIHDATWSGWSRLRELQCDSIDQPHRIIKLPTTPTQFLATHCELGDDADIRSHLSVAGNVMWIWTRSETATVRVATYLAATQQSGLVIRGNSANSCIGSGIDHPMHHRIKHAMDPHGKFPSHSSAG